MHVIHRTQMSKVLEPRRLRAFRKKILRDLAREDLPADKRAALEGKLRRLEQGISTSAATPGPAIKARGPNKSGRTVAVASDSPQESPPTLLTEKQLLRKKHAELLAIGEGEGAKVEPSMTKAVLVAAILAHRAA